MVTGAKRLRAGAAKAEITTDKAAVNDPLYVRAMVIDDGETAAAIIALDAVGLDEFFEISDDYLPKIKKRLERELGIDGENILVNTTHTHIAGRMLCDGDTLIARTVKAVAEAKDKMEDVLVGAGIGEEKLIAINRDLRLKSGKHWTIRHTNPCPPDDEVADIGDIDANVGLLRFDRLNGEVLAVIVNFGCHPLLGVPDGSITANYPGFACRVIEENLNKDTTAIFLQGAGGDVVETLFKTTAVPMDSEPVGMLFGINALRTIRSISTRDSTINVVSKRITLPRRTDIPQKIEELKEEQKKLLDSLRYLSLNFKSFLPLYLAHKLNPDYPSDYSYRYIHEEKIGINKLRSMDKRNRENVNKYLENIKAMEKLTRIQDRIATLNRHYKINLDSGSDSIEAEIVGIRIGDCVIISAPVEMLTEVGKNIKEKSPYKYTFISAFSNGYMHYGPPERYYELDGYEVTECFLGPGWQKLYEDAALEVINSL